jgi:site-specific recombinase XerD
MDELRACLGGCAADMRVEVERGSYGSRQGIKSAYVFVNERGEPFGRMGIARMIERAGEAAALPFPIHVHMLPHSTGYALAAKGMDTRRLQHYLGQRGVRPSRCFRLLLAL